MTPTEQGLLHAIVHEPDDDTHRLIYSDWLDDHGDPERAEFIRAQVQLARDGTDSPERRALAYRAWHLLDQHEEAWTDLRPALALEWRFVRGFVEHLLVCGDQFPGLLAVGTLNRLPLRSLALVRLADITALESLPVAHNLRRLDLTGTPLAPDDVRFLARTPVLAGLRDLNLIFTFLTDDHIDAVQTLRTLRPLARLGLGGNGFSEQGLAQLRREWGVGVSWDIEREPNYLYRIQDPGDTDRFLTGTTPDHCQLFFHRAYRESQVALFDYEGNLLRIDRRPIANPDQFDERDAADLAWIKEYQVSPGTIRVKRFRLDQRHGIHDFPYYFAENHSADIDLREFLPSEVARWIECGSFEWEYEGDNFWLDRTGEVTAT